jgi:hypothetical protein
MSLDVTYQGTMSDSAMGQELRGTRRLAWPREQQPETPTHRARGDQGQTPGEDRPGPAVGCCDESGVIEIRDPRLLRRGREAFCLALVDAAVNRFGAIHASVSLETATCRLEFEPGQLDRAEMGRRVASAVHAAIPAVRDISPSRDELDDGRELDSSGGAAPDDGAAGSPERRGRIGHLAMAGGSFAMAGAAAILPGLPALPFLVNGGRHSLLISPWVERILERYPLGVAVLEKLDAESGTTFNWGSLLRMLALAAALAAAIWFLQPPLPVVLLLEVGLMALQACWEWLASPAAEAGLMAMA